MDTVRTRTITAPGIALVQYQCTNCLQWSALALHMATQTLCQGCITPVLSKRKATR